MCFGKKTTISPDFKPLMPREGTRVMTLGMSAVLRNNKDKKRVQKLNTKGKVVSAKQSVNEASTLSQRQCVGLIMATLIDTRV